MICDKCMSYTCVDLCVCGIYKVCVCVRVWFLINIAHSADNKSNDFFNFCELWRDLRHIQEIIYITIQSVPLPSNQFYYHPISSITIQSVILPPNQFHNYHPISSITIQSVLLPSNQFIYHPCVSTNIQLIYHPFSSFTIHVFLLTFSSFTIHLELDF